MPRSVLLAAVALAGVIVSVAMVVLGLPEANPVQSVLLELSSLPLSVAVAAGLGILQQRAVRQPGRRSLRVLLAAAVAVIVGLVLVGWAYAFGPREVVHTGQLLIWLGLFAGLVVLVRLQPRRRHTSYRIEEEPDEAEVADPDAPASI